MLRVNKLYHDSLLIRGMNMDIRKMLMEDLGLLSAIQTANTLLNNQFINERINSCQKYQGSLNLNRYERKIFSQNGEDGILEEIFNRIGTTNLFFVEFGVADGSENNTLFLLLRKWRGCWIEANSKNTHKIKARYDHLIDGKKLLFKEAMITAENVESIFHEMNIPEEFDLLSIDIDGNDYYVWKAINQYKPRVVVIEYNSFFPPSLDRVTEYNANSVWDGSGYLARARAYGASLRALEILGKTKGYKLVGCDFRGVNSFFVRDDLINKNFQSPFTAEMHYEEPKYTLVLSLYYLFSRLKSGLVS